MSAVGKTSSVCDELGELLGDYVDEELPSSMAARFKQHLSGCSECRALERDYRRTVEIAGLLKDKPLPPGAKDRLREGLNRRLGINLPLFK